MGRESERAVRELFERAQEVAPVVLFFDEFDALGRQREGGEGPTILIQSLFSC